MQSGCVCGGVCGGGGGGGGHRRKNHLNFHFSTKNLAEKKKRRDGGTRTHNRRNCEPLHCLLRHAPLQLLVVRVMWEVLGAVR